MYNSLRPQRLWPARLLCPWNSPGKRIVLELYWNSPILEWVIVPSSRGSSQPRDQTHVCHIADRFFTIGATREAHIVLYCNRFMIFFIQIICKKHTK